MKAFTIFTIVQARKVRCCTLNCGARAFSTGCRKLHAFHANGFDKLGKRERIDALKQFGISVSRDVIPINNFHISLLSATKVEITQARQDTTSVHGSVIRQRVFAKSAAYHHFLCFCAFRFFSNDNKAAMKILLSSQSERCYFSIHRVLLFQMTYIIQYGLWCLDDCHVFCL